MDNYRTAVDILIKDEVAGNPHHERVLVLGATPEILCTKCGFTPLPLAISGKVISKACFDHGIGTNILKGLYKIVANSKSIYKSADPKFTDSVVLITVETHNSWPIVIPIRKNQNVGRGTYLNMIVSIYGKEGPDPATKWEQKGLLLWKDS